MSTKKTTKKAVNASSRSQKKAYFLPGAKPIPAAALPKKWDIKIDVSHFNFYFL